MFSVFVNFLLDHLIHIFSVYPISPTSDIKDSTDIDFISEIMIKLHLYSQNERGKNMICHLEKWKLSDAADLTSIISNKKIQDNLRDGLPYPYTQQDGIDYISFLLSSNENDTFAFAITVEGKIVGSIAAFRQENVHRRTAELGYYLAEEYWGKGIMPEAVKQICDYIFSNSDILGIYAEPFAYNTASCRVLEKAGFQYEGTLRNNAIKNGKILDMKMYSRLKSDS